MNKLVILFSVVTFISSCRKERLDSDYSSQLIGTWQLSQSKHVTNTWPNIDTTYYYPSSADELELEFCEKGILFLHIEGEEKVKYRIREITDFDNGSVQVFNLNLRAKDDNHEFVFWFWKSETNPYIHVDEDLSFLGLNDEIGLPNGSAVSTFLKK